MNNMQRMLVGLLTALVLSSCANYEYPSQVSIGGSMIEARGESL
jgi:hypothetical protein